MGQDVDEEARKQRIRDVSAVARTRDREAFTRLFDHFAPRLNAYLRRLRLAPETAEELSQEVMEVVWRKAHLFDPAKSSVATWIFRIALNRRIDLGRRDRDRAGGEPAVAELIDLRPGSDDSLDSAQREARVRAALAALAPAQRDLVQLAFFDGLSHSAIADRTGLPLGTVKSRLRLAFGRLRRELAARGVTDAM